MKNSAKNILGRIEGSRVASAIRSGLVMLIPILLIGSMMLILKSLPIAAYQTFITSLLDGFFVKVFDFVYNATFGMLSVFVTIFVSYCYAKGNRTDVEYPFGAIITSLTVFFILVGASSGDAAWKAIGVKGMFTAIISSTLVPHIYSNIVRFVRVKSRPYSDGADAEFTKSLGNFLPALIVIFFFAALNALVSELFGVASIHALLVAGINSLFEPLGETFLSGMLMVFFSSVLWFFGIHGSDVLENVMDGFFTPAMAVNQQLLTAGGEPTEILTKTFFDVFVLIGGCGTAMCLLLAILLFSKRASNRRLGRMAALPMLFNINELMIFGFPVIYNPTLLVPFILTPIISFLISYSAMAFGIVPLTTTAVEWTTPVLIGGYQATGSIMGSALQLANIIAGVLIYRPFVLMYDRNQERNAKKHLEELVRLVKRNERNLSDVTLTELSTAQGEIARALSADLGEAVGRGELKLYYQPQYDNKGELVGAEALLRWNHPRYGFIYPPLIIELAREAGRLPDLERGILQRAVKEAKEMWERAGKRIKLSINVSAATLHDDAYMSLLRELSADSELRDSVCLEITEQTALSSGKETSDIFERVRDMGFKFAIDDFSMGHTSMAYLQEHRFDLVKLDGSLVRGMRDNPRCKDIIASIIQLSKPLGFEVLAEYVETGDMRDDLEQIGCYLYQGYYYSPAIPADEFAEKLVESEKAASR